jgi:RNA polymerase-binding transcription factor DksA
MPTKKKLSAAASKAVKKVAKAAPPKKSTVTKTAATKAPVKKTAKPAVKKSAPKSTAPVKAATKPAVKAAVKATAKAPVKKAVKAVAKKPVAKKPETKPVKAPAKVSRQAPVTVKKTATPATKKAAPSLKQAPPAPAKPVAAPAPPKPEAKPLTEFAKTAASTNAARMAEMRKAARAKESQKPLKPVVIPKINTTTSRKYEPEFTKSVLDQPTQEQTGPTMRYSDAELQEFRELIARKLDAAKKELAYLHGLITRKDSMSGDETDNRYMTMEDGSLSMEREQLSQMASRQIDFIDKLEKALMRIENKTYGICRVTGELIDKARLRAVPHATLSMAAKTGMTKNPNIQ